MPDELPTFFIKIIFFIKIHKVKTVVIPISDDDELSLKDVVHFINQIYFTETNIVLLSKKKRGIVKISIHQINIST